MATGKYAIGDVVQHVLSLRIGTIEEVADDRFDTYGVSFADGVRQIQPINLVLVMRAKEANECG
jgi:hypothetical protein